MKHLFILALSCLTLLLPTGCSILSDNDQKVDYKKSTSTDPLILPPDLSASLDQELVIPEGGTTLTDYNRAEGGRISLRQGKAVLPQFDDIRMQREKGIRWLEINAAPGVVWPKLVRFWEGEGFTLKVQDPAIGLIETEWAENRADIPQDVIRRLLGRALEGLYSASTRDKFIIRLERGEQADQSLLYVSHRGAREVTQDDTFVWEFRPSDPGLETELLNRFLVHLGLEREQAERVTAKENTREIAKLATHGGQPAIVIAEPFAQGWRRVKIALDRAGFTVEDRNREEGVFFVRHTEDLDGRGRSLWDKLAFWKDEKGEQQTTLRVRVQPVDGRTLVTLEDEDQQAVPEKAANTMLELLHGRM